MIPSARLASLPPALRWAVVLLALEAVGAAATAVAQLYFALTDDVMSRTAALSVPAYILVIGAALAGVAAALVRRRPRARAPALVLQLLGVVVAYVLTTSGLFWLAIPVAAVALTVITLLLTPQVSQALGE